MEDITAATSLPDEAKAETVAALHPLVQDIQEKFQAAKDARRSHEERWNRAWYNFRGEYGKEVQFTEMERSRVFVKITKTKVMAAYGQVVDVLFSSDKLPITIEATPDPEGIEADVHVDLNDPMGEPELDQPVIGYSGDGKDLLPGETLVDRIGSWLSEKLQNVKVKKGPGLDPQTHLSLSPAEIAAKKMERKIHDQFVETDADSVVASSAFECVFLGTGIIKGPFIEDKEYPKWDEEGNYTPIKKPVPRIEHVRCWDFYPDPEAVTLSDADYVIERHKLTRNKLRSLKKRPHFRASAIEEAIELGTSSDRFWWEHEIQETDNVGTDYSRYEVVEFWGTIDGAKLQELDFPNLPDDIEDFDEFEINAWVCNGILLRVVINPFQPSRIPYLTVPYEVNPYSPFGIGVPENMEDSQTIMNGFARMAIDNAALAGNLMIEVDETNLVPGQDMRVYPGKVWRRQGGAPGQAIFGTKWPSTVQENMQVFDKFRQLADEATGIPSYSHGQTGISATNRTAAGVSMLMGASALNIKTVIKNFDKYLLKPLGEAMFAFNMQFNFDPDIKGDLAIKAAGTVSLMQREVKSQRIMQFIQVGSNPMTAPWVNFEYLMKEAARTLDLDEEKAVNNPKMAALQARVMAATNGIQAQPEGMAPGGPQGSMMNDPNQTGGGQIGGAGAPPMPGQEQFSGSPQQPQGLNATMPMGQ